MPFSVILEQFPGIITESRKVDRKQPDLREEEIMKRDREIVNTIVPLTFMYNYRVGKSMDKYLKGLAGGKILGVRCEKCKRVIVPPRTMCGRCNVEMKEWVDVSQEGTLRNFTVGRVKIENGEIAALTEPQIIGMVKLENADSLLCAEIKGIPEGDLKAGIRVKAAWKEKRDGSVRDLDCFTPA